MLSGWEANRACLVGIAPHTRHASQTQSDVLPCGLMACVREMSHAVALRSAEGIYGLCRFAYTACYRHWAAGFRGKCAVHEASRVDVLRLLVRRGADVNVHDDDGQTALHVASRHGNIRLVHELASAGADLRATDHLGRSAVHYAALGNAVCVP